MIVNTHVPSEDQIQENADGSQEGTQGQRQDPKGQVLLLPLPQTLLLLEGGRRLKDKPQGTRWLGQLCYVSPLQLPQTSLRLLFGSHRGCCLLS